MGTVAKTKTESARSGHRGVEGGSGGDGQRDGGGESVVSQAIAAAEASIHNHEIAIGMEASGASGAAPLRGVLVLMIRATE